jgi:sterol desaturase/sphingolipid hydroxylase (fatty acid hydroxylase superfamily)
MPELLAHASLAQLAALVAAFFVGLTLLSVAAGFLAERLFPKRRVMALPLPEGQLRHELLGNVVFVSLTIACFTAALQSGLVLVGPTSLAREVTTFVVLMFGFQIYYYFLHRAMHAPALLPFHAWHHRSQVTTALTGQSVSFGEALGWMVGYVALPLALSRLWPIGFGGWAAYMAFNVSGNIVGHANVELTSRLNGTRVLSAFANPWVYHALHHARWTGHFGFQAAWMDRLFGSEFADWPALHARILGGQPMKSLKERGTDAP